MLVLFSAPIVFVLLAVAGLPANDAIPPTSQTMGEGQSLFETQCRVCHSLGADRVIGPGLEDISERRDRAWLVAFITAPDRMVADGDPIATELFEEYQIPMPNLGLTEAQAESILDFLAGAEGAAPVVSAPPTRLPDGDAAMGRELFIGGHRLEEGGAACISCHNIAGLGPLGGGTLAKELSGAAALYGVGLPALLEAPPYPAMQAIYANRPLTPVEVANLSAFLAAAEQGDTPANSRFPFPAAGFGGLVLLAASAGLLWRGRLRGVRKPLIGEQK
jgi:mono/diheme cytochrome c family protein